MLVENLQREIELIENEIRKMEQLNLTADGYYYVLQAEKLAKLSELEYCKEVLQEKWK